MATINDSRLSPMARAGFQAVIDQLRSDLLWQALSGPNAKAAPKVAINFTRAPLVQPPSCACASCARAALDRANGKIRELHMSAENAEHKASKADALAVNAIAEQQAERARRLEIEDTAEQEIARAERRLSNQAATIREQSQLIDQAKDEIERYGAALFEARQTSDKLYTQVDELQDEIAADKAASEAAAHDRAAQVSAQLLIMEHAPDHIDLAEARQRAKQIASLVRDPFITLEGMI